MDFVVLGISFLIYDSEIDSLPCSIFRQLASPDGGNVEDEFLDPNSQLGVFLRSCILAFNSMTFEVLQVEYCIHSPLF